MQKLTESLTSAVWGAYWELSPRSRKDLGFNPVPGPFCVEFGLISVGNGFSQAAHFQPAAHHVEKMMIIKSQYNVQWLSLWQSTHEYMTSY